MSGETGRMFCSKDVRRGKNCVQVALNQVVGATWAVEDGRMSSTETNGGRQRRVMTRADKPFDAQPRVVLALRLESGSHKAENKPKDSRIPREATCSHGHTACANKTLLMLTIRRKGVFGSYGGAQGQCRRANQKSRTAHRSCWDVRRRGEGACSTLNER